MGIALLIVCLGYLILAAIIFFITKKLVKSKIIVVLVALVLVLYPFRRVIFYQTLFYFYDRTPLQEIHQTVASPESVYWEDNVWPGFDEYGRHWMVKNYLDGVHLKVLALNGDDGKIYLYRASAEDFAGSIPLIEQIKVLEKKKTILNEKFHEIYKKEFLAVHKPLRFPEDNEIKRDYIDSHPLHQKVEKFKQQIGILKESLHKIKKRGEQKIFARKEKYENKNDLPPMDYRVEFNLLPKSLVINNDYHMLHADRISIIDAKSNQEIAYSQRYMAHAGFISKFSGQQPKFDMKLGDIRVYEFDDKVLFEWADADRGYDINRKYKLYSRIAK